MFVSDPFLRAHTAGKLAHRAVTARALWRDLMPHIALVIKRVDMASRRTVSVGSVCLSHTFSRAHNILCRFSLFFLTDSCFRDRCVPLVFAVSRVLAVAVAAVTCCMCRNVCAWVKHHPAYATAAGVWPVVFGALAPLRPLRSLRPLPLFLSLFPRVPLFFVSFVLSPFLPCCYFP